MSTLLRFGFGLLFNLALLPIDAGAQCLEKIIAPPERSDSSRFGSAMAVEGRWLAIGAYGEPVDSDSLGIVEIYRNTGREWLLQTRLEAPAGARLYGQSVDLREGLLAVGAPGSFDNDGIVFLYEWTGADWALTQTFQPAAGLEGSFGFSVALSESGLMVGAPIEGDGSFRDVGAAYFYRKLESGWSTGERLGASDPTTTGFLALSIDVDGDLAILGAPESDEGGKALVFRDVPGSGWQEEQVLGTGSSELRYRLGYRVATDSDRIAVSAPEYDQDGRDGVGAVFVYTESAPGTWSKEATLTVVDEESVGSQLGRSLWMRGDIVWAGAPFWDDNRGPSRYGRITRFEHDGANWSAGSSLIPTTINGNQEFGTELAIDDDWLVVSAVRGDDANADWPGFAHVYRQNCPPTWTEGAPLIPEIAQNGRQFGKSLAIDAAGAVIGGPDDGERGPAAGAVWWFEHGDDGLERKQKITASDAGTEDRFGWSVDLSSDRMSVTAPGSYSNPMSRGAAYVFIRQNGLWTEEARFDSSQPASHDGFGSVVALLPETAFVGAPLDDTSQLDAGLVRVFERAGLAWTESTSIASPDPAPGDLFGWALDAAEDLLIVGAPLANGASTDDGAAYLFQRGEQGWTFVRAFFAPDGQSGDRFGSAVSLKGRFLAIGASHNGPGEVHLYRRVGAGWQSDGVLTPESGTDHRFGSALALDWNHLIVGAPREDTFAPDGGAAWVYGRESAGWMLQQPLTAFLPETGAELGQSVGIEGGLALAGLPLADSGGFDSGSVSAWEIARGELSLIGDPGPSQIVHFEAQVVHPSEPGNVCTVLLSASGRVGIALPLDGRQLPLTFDAVTALSASLSSILSAAVGEDGIAMTPDVLLPSTLPGLTLDAAAVTWDPLSGQWISVLGPIRFATE